MKATLRPPNSSPRTSTGVADAGLLLHVVTNNPLTLQEELAAAVLTVQESGSPEDPQGILLTRHSKTLFTVTYSPDVPHGTTMEQDRWHRDS